MFQVKITLDVSLCALWVAWQFASVFVRFISVLRAMELPAAVCNCTTHVSEFKIHLTYFLGE